MLVGEGAKLWAIDNKLEEVDDNFHKTGKPYFLNIVKQAYDI